MLSQGLLLLSNFEQCVFSSTTVVWGCFFSLCLPLLSGRNDIAAGILQIQCPKTPVRGDFSLVKWDYVGVECDRCTNDLKFFLLQVLFI